MPLIKTDGTYTATVQSAKFGQSDNGTPFIQFAFVADEGEITGWAYLSEKAFENTVKSLREAFGFDGNFEGLNPAEDGSFDCWNGKQCKIVVVLEEYDGKERAKVKFINGLNGGVSSKPISNQRSVLAALSGKAARIPVKAAAPAKAPRQNPF